MTGIICGTGSYAPANYLDNHEISNMVDTSDEWIRERTGIIKRRIAGEETTVSMAAEASRRALENSKIQAEELDLIIVATCSSEVVMPCTACEVQKEIGAVHAACFDINAACAGFVFGYSCAQAYIMSGMYQTVLLIGSESLSKYVDWKDRSTCILFGDGAGAAVIRKGEGKNYLPVTCSDGTGGSVLSLKSRRNEGSHADTYIRMEGQPVFKFAVKKVPVVINQLLEKNNVSIEEIDWFVLHQANKRIIHSIAARLKVPQEKFPVNVEEYGNTSSASIGLLLDEMNRGGLLKKGQKIVLAGFGAGLSWGAAILEW